MGSKLQKKIIIIGAGVIGCSCAYYLTRHPKYDRTRHSITVVEAVAVANGSSGHAGGLLQVEAEPACLAPLSFQLHTTLAERHEGAQAWGYRQVNVGECELVGRGVPLSQQDSMATGNMNDELHRLESLGWIVQGSMKAYKPVSDITMSAQLLPLNFTKSMANLAEEQGVKFVHGTVTRLNYDEEMTRAESITYRPAGGMTDVLLPLTEVVVCAGPWTSSLVPLANIGGAKSHSIVFDPMASLSNQCLWANIKKRSPDGTTGAIDLELYPRPDRTLYSCDWANPNLPLHDVHEDVKVDTCRCLEIQDALASISDELRDSKLSSMQACFQPVILMDGIRAKNIGPLLGVTGLAGVVLACGHDSWGVQNAPATGLVVSEMLLDGGARSADISSLDPRKILRRAKVF